MLHLCVIQIAVYIDLKCTLGENLPQAKAKNKRQSWLLKKDGEKR